MCDQQRLRPAWAYAQSDPSLFLLLEYSMTVKLLTEQHLEFLSLKGCCTGSSESTLVKMPHCWKSHVMAHLLCGCWNNQSTLIHNIMVRYQNDVIQILIKKRKILIIGIKHGFSCINFCQVQKEMVKTDGKA